MRRIPKNVKIYPISEAQWAEVQAQSLCLHKNVVQIPLYILTEKKVDFDLMRRAIAEEIRRNDSMRLFFFQKKLKVHQYFLPEFTPEKIPFHDFTGETEEDMLAWLKKDASAPVRYLKGESWRMRLFRAPDGRSGIFININHAGSDLFGIFTFFRDLLEVYDALEKGTELPPPPTSFEEILQKEFARSADAEKQEQHRQFFSEIFKKDGPASYTGADGMRQINALRAKKKDPNINAIHSIDLLCDKSDLIRYSIPKEVYDGMKRFCADNNTTMQSLIYMGYRTWLSRINEYAKDVHASVMLNRRATLAEKHCGGCLVNMVPLRTVLDEDTTFLEALRYATDYSRQVMRHADMGFTNIYRAIAKVEKHSSVLDPVTWSMILTVVPDGALQVPEGWNIELGGVGAGRFCQNVYALAIPGMVDGGLDCNYQFRTNYITAEDIRALHENAVKVIRAGISDPQVTVGKLLHEVLG